MDDIGDGRNDSGGARRPVGAARVRAMLERACRPCPQATSALRRDLLCRCPIALASRCLAKVERHGDDPLGLPHAELASLDFQERSLEAIPASVDLASLQEAGRRAGELGHSSCKVVGCLTCRALRRVQGLASDGG